MNLYISIVLIFFLSLTSCNEEIPIDNIKFEEQIFISGVINNETDFVFVEIKKTVPITDTNVNFVSDAKILLFSKDANAEVTLITDVFEIDETRYKSVNMITPVIGNSYWIEVLLNDGTVLKSDEDILRSVVEIKKIKKEDDIITAFYDDPIEEDNFYIYNFRFFKKNNLTDNFTFLGNDRLSNGNRDAEIAIIDDEIAEYDTLEVSIKNVSFNTYQYYSNLLSNQVEEDVSFSSPINIIGNITNTKLNRRSLGNFDVVGLSSLSKKF